MAPSIKYGVDWIALNDESGGDERLDVSSVASYISTALLADLFGKTPEDIAKRIVRRREQLIKSGEL